MRTRWRGVAVATLVVGLLTGSGQQAAFPPDLVRWEPATEGAVFAGTGGDSWDRKIRERGWILREGDVYHLWYTGYNDNRSPNRFLGHATSTDGLTWTRDPANPLLADSWVEDVCVVKDGGRFVMFAEGKDDIAHSLVSTDGTTWEELGPLDIRRRADGQPISAGPRGTPTAWLEGGIWYLFYERGDQGVWLATSADRKLWTNVSDDPVLPMGPDAYDRHAVAINQILKRDGVYYAYYHANSQRPWVEWTTCIARSKDLIHWEKYAGNPILAGNRSSGILVEGPSGARLFTMHPEVRPFRNPGPP